MTARPAALVFAGLTALVCAFHIALALGAPWGEFAMGGAFPGAYPPVMRVLACIQIVALGLIALVVLCRAGLVLPRWSRYSRKLVWAIVALLTAGFLLNLATPSEGERLVWAPVALALLLTSLRVATSR